MTTKTIIRMERLAQARGRLGVSESTFYNFIHAGLLPPGVPVGGRVVGWPSHELDAILAARLNGADDVQVRSLVQKLVADRATVGA